MNVKNQLRLVTMGEGSEKIKYMNSILDSD